MTRTPDMPVHIRRDRFDPAPELGRLRTEQPVSRVRLVTGAPAWLVTRYEDVREVLGDSGRFGNSEDGRPAGAPPLRVPDTEAEVPRLWSPGNLLAYDPPEHTRLRRLVTGEFTVKRMRRLRPRIEAIVTEHLDAMERSGPPADLVQSFALPIPSLVICELLGVPYTDRADFQHRSNIRLDLSLGLDRRVAAMRESQEYMAGLVAAQRKRPGEDMLGMLVREHGDEISDEELTGLADLLLIAGHETTSNMLGLGTLFLLRNPGHLAWARQDEHIDAVVEELLRHLSIVHTVIPRVVRADTVVSGQPLKAGDLVVCSLPAANRDPALTADPDRFDPGRKVSHLAFGHGIHHCLGAPLARMEMRIAYPALLRRFPALRPAVPFEEVRFRMYSVVHGLESLPVAW
ncbi:cytochrome P450 [Streptomyces sp. NPDC095613]|uniref:cytochrome P450 n=1 Tax=Streptomyces sp. NPDC095613 TaxID=3155540 RepID=UPI0033295344